jgi:hypothetical protein
MHPRKFILGALVLAMSALASAPASAIVITSFGPFGEAGSIPGIARPLFIGTGGDVNELDAFLWFGGGPSFRLSDGDLPGAGVDVGFGYALSDGSTDLTLTYTFTNTNATALMDVRFFSFLDADIDETTNSLQNEYGEVLGSPGAGAGDLDPDSWEIDEPGYCMPDFICGNVYDNLFDLGILENTNAIPASAEDDVSLALGFLLGPLGPSSSVSIRVFISEDLDSIGNLSLVHRDSWPDSADESITMSGQVVAAQVPEPSTLFLLGAGLTALATVRRRRSGGWSPRRRTRTSRRRGLPG